MRAYRLTVGALFAFVPAASYFYAGQKGVPPGIAVPVAAALIVELSLYASLAFEECRGRLEKLGGKLPGMLIISALAPYLIYSLPAGMFRWDALVVLAVLAALVTLWFRLLPPSFAGDLGFLVLMAAVLLAKLFRGVYTAPIPGLPVEVLGQLMWIRLGVVSVLLVRRFEGIGFGFLPSPGEWLIGLRHFFYFLPLGVALIFGLRFARLDPAPGLWWKLPLTFLGFLWVVALSEEFFFRGVLQQLLSKRLGSPGGLLATSLLFGAAHLPFREFPNWEFAALAAVAGLFYGRAFLRGNGIRAAMVTHALVVACWRTLFR